MPHYMAADQNPSTAVLVGQLMGGHQVDEIFLTASRRMHSPGGIPRPGRPSHDATEGALSLMPTVRNSFILSALDHLRIQPLIVNGAATVTHDVIARVRDFLGIGQPIQEMLQRRITYNDVVPADTMSDWYGHDMNVWPPTNLANAHGPIRTHSVIYAPLLMDALGEEVSHGVFRSAFPFQRPTVDDGFDWDGAVRIVRRYMLMTNTIDYWRQAVPLDGPLHPTAAFQEDFFNGPSVPTDDFNDDLALASNDVMLVGQTAAIYINSLASDHPPRENYVDVGVVIKNCNVSLGLRRSTLW
jgi:hypothetical protein